MSKAYLVVRISGTADVPYWATTTMNLLKLEKKHRAVIIPEIDNTMKGKKSSTLCNLART
jgi:Ribosomal protein L30p/L7e.